MMQPPPTDATEYKACCAALYENVGVRFLLGDTWRPGGQDTTLALAGAADLQSGADVLDLACGIGDTVRLLCNRYDATVTGLDLTPENLYTARDRSSGSGLGSPAPGYLTGDAEALPFASASFDALFCECAVSTFADKFSALVEAARVLKPGGVLCLSDVVLEPDALPPELDSLFSRIACLGGALTAAGYAAHVQAAGLTVEHSLDFSEVTMQFLHDIDRKLLLARLAQAVRKIDLGGIDVVDARRVLKDGMALVEQRKLGYVGIVARKQ